MSLLQQLFLPFTSHKYLWYQLTARDIKARYKQSFLGYAWVLFNPIALMLIYSFIYSIIFRFSTNDVPYQVFLFAALLPWTSLQMSIHSATMSLVDNAILLRKVAFPREIIPYAAVIAKITDFLFSSIVFIGLLAFYQVSLAGTAWLFIPLFLLQMTLTIGISLLLATFNLFYRDIQHVTNLLLMIWMYMSPVIYPVSLVPQEYLWIYKLNPMVGIIEGYRSALFGYAFDYSAIGWSIGVSLIVFFLGYALFKKSEPVFADIV
jgi:lipopolysaccharide transport system permease protein